MNNSLQSRRESYGSCDLSLLTGTNSETESRVLTLAEQIIAAMPDRIKATSEASMNGLTLAGLHADDGKSTSSLLQDTSDLEICPVDEPPPPLLGDEFNFEFSDHNYRLE